MCCVKSLQLLISNNNIRINCKLIFHDEEMKHICILLKLVLLSFIAMCISAQNLPIIAVFVEKSSIEILMNWMLNFLDVATQSQAEKLLIFCMDHSSKILLSSVGIYCKLALHSTSDTTNKKQNFGDIWLQRMVILNSLLREKNDIILSDIDAIWKQNPLSYLFDVQDAPIVASRGSWPFGLQQKWGSCVCMGFLYVKYHPLSIEFFGEVEKYLIDEHQISPLAPDDQIAVNTVLDRRRIQWSHFPMSWNSSAISYGYIKDDKSNQHTLIALLPNEIVTRKCSRVARKAISEVEIKEMKELTKNALVIHCRLPRGHWTVRILRLKVFGLWKLRDYWKTFRIPPPSFDPVLIHSLNRSIIDVTLLKQSMSALVNGFAYLKY